MVEGPNDAIRLATTNAAKAGGVPRRKGGLIPGDRADFVQFRLNPTVEVVGTYISGRKVFAS